MLISPPRDEYPDFHEEPYQSIKSQKWYDWFFNCPNWICPKCILTNFGRNKHCADTRCKEPRPLTFKENVYEL